MTPGAWWAVGGVAAAGLVGVGVYEHYKNKPRTIKAIKHPNTPPVSFGGTCGYTLGPNNTATVSGLFGSVTAPLTVINLGIDASPNIGTPDAPSATICPSPGGRIVSASVGGQSVSLQKNGSISITISPSSTASPGDQSTLNVNWDDANGVAQTTSVPIAIFGT